MRLDQWRMVEPLLEPFFHIDRRTYWSILPTATPYARNALFAGLYPLEIARALPGTGGSRRLDATTAAATRTRASCSASSWSACARRPQNSYRYYKVSDARDTDHLRRDYGSLGGVRLVAAVYNFLDIMAHGRSQSHILKELAPDEAAFRSLMRSWFEHSSLFEVIKDAGAARLRRSSSPPTTARCFCRRATQVRGNRDTSNNVRYKFGDNLCGGREEGHADQGPRGATGCRRNSSIENYAITTENYYLVYPTNFHEYERLYRDSFQHGGISLEELICPFARPEAALSRGAADEPEHRICPIRRASPSACGPRARGRRAALGGARGRPAARRRDRSCCTAPLGAGKTCFVQGLCRGARRHRRGDLADLHPGQPLRGPAASCTTSTSTASSRTADLADIGVDATAGRGRADGEAVLVAEWPGRAWRRWCPAAARTAGRCRARRPRAAIWHLRGRAGTAAGAWRGAGRAPEAAPC